MRGCRLGGRLEAWQAVAESPGDRLEGWKERLPSGNRKLEDRSTGSRRSMRLCGGAMET